ncbi:MAG: extracellular solute-binding protein [Anaerolineales bacterium]|nr:extracellular solute-binding protein [Anaerolineales bacterium]
MKRKLFALIAILAFVLAACGGGTEISDEPASGETTGGGQGPTVIRIWVHTNNAFIAGYDALIAAYEAEHPEVDIQLENFDYELYLQTLQTAMPAGEEADILQLFGTWTSQYYERLAPVPAEVMTVAQAQELFYAAPIGGYIVDGVLYGMPQEFNCEYGGVLVNKTLYEAAGLTYPPQWETMDDVIADALVLAQSDNTGMMTTAGFHFTSADPTVASFLAGIRQRGGDYWNADQTGFTFNTPEARAQLEWMAGAVDAGVVDPIVFNDSTNFVIDAFFQGKVGIGYIGTWAIAEGQANFPDFADEWDYFYLPAIEGDPVFVADSGWGLTVSPNSEHQDIAWDFILFATASVDNAAQWNIASGTIPAMPAVAESAEIAEAMPWIPKALDILPYGQYLGNMPDRDLVVYEIIYPHILNVLQGVETIDQALETIDAEANSTFR